MGLTCYICRRKASKGDRISLRNCTGTSAAGQHRTGSRRLHESTIIEDLTNMVEKEMTKKKRIWTRKWIGDRAVRCGSTKQLRSENPAEYRLALRLIPKNFDESLIESSIQRQDTMMREALLAKIKLEVTLTYLATDFSILFTSK
ncbi:hypothetical protein PV328_010313 [Microctonus aethiopoides]|uniref:Uncharacterized protein n=1 Tax=Microctonus aethiopoides TaxID=144406 RepID=A0AA39F079_9HYME|nr:hypothetical protein PV328_010313 [Microctonus aethiopoides]